MRTTIALDKLFMSPKNVRKTNPDEDIEGLADSIFEKGLLENLVVSPRATGRGSFDVDAGGRRWRALKRNAELKRIPRNHPVDCLVVPAEDAAEASMAENLHTVAMNPADEVVGFTAILESYARAGITDRDEQIQRCARRFGKSFRYVEERLRLAELAPDILEALRLGAISIDAAKVYAAYPDQELQMKVFAAQEATRAQGYNRHSPAAIRSMLAGKIYRKGDRQVRFIGVDAYIAAGGRVELELFMGNEDEEVLLDTALVDRLVRAKGEPECERLARADGFLEGQLWGWGPQTGWPKTPAGYEAIWEGEPRLAPDERAEAIGLYAIAPDGSELVLSPHCFRRKVARPAGDGAGAGGADGSLGRHVENEIERLARIRRERIERRAIHLALPEFEGTPLGGRAYAPPEGTCSIPPVQRDPEGNYIVAILVTVPKAEVEARMGQAEHLDDEEEDGRDTTPAAAPELATAEPVS